MTISRKSKTLCIDRQGDAVFRNLEAIRLADMEPEPEQDAPDGKERHGQAS